VLASSAAVFAALAATVLLWERVDRLDVRFVNWVHATAPDPLVDVMQVVTYAGSAVILGPLAILAAALLVRRGLPGAALFVVAAAAGSLLLDQTLKAVLRRARPELEDPFVQLTTYAFPSGHAFEATATYGALALVLASAAADRGRRVGLLALAGAVILVVAASRVIVGAHYLLDVLAGIAGGVAVVSALLLVLGRQRSPALRVMLFRGDEQAQRSGLDA
jgi:undecaprenyl-diphosphatase